MRRRLKWPRWREHDLDNFWGADSPFWLGGDDFVVAGLIFGVVLFIVLGVVIVLLLPLLLFLLEALLAIAAVLALRGTWRIEAETIGPPPEAKAWTVRGWRASKRAAEEVAHELAMGVPAEPETGISDPTR